MIIDSSISKNVHHLITMIHQSITKTMFDKEIEYFQKDIDDL